jgi:hypothetical protein
MKKWLYFIAVFILAGTRESFFLCAQTSYNQSSSRNATQNTNSAVPSNAQNQAGFNGNDIVTGNIRAGKQFQGAVPYRSASSFNATLGSSALSSFMRDSAGSESIGNYLAGNRANSAGTSYQSYSLPSQTVTSVSNNNSITPSYTNSSANYGNDYGSNLQNRFNQPQVSSQQNLNTSVSPLQQYDLQAAQPQNQSSNPYMQSYPQTRTDSDQITQSLAAITEKLNALEKRLDSGNYNNNSAIPSDNMQRYLTNVKSNETASPSELYSGVNDNTSSNYSRNIAGQNPYQSGTNNLSTGMSQPQYQQTNWNNNPASRQQSYDSLDQIKAKLDELNRSIDYRLPANTENPKQFEPTGISSRQESASSFRTYSQSQFNNYFVTAQEQLSQGNYYQAADAFTLASIYEPDNAFCYAGKGHALFAAGQYVTSALFIIRAIELNPDYLQSNINLEIITGSRNIIAGKILELEQLLRKDPASGLQFLMAYVYYRTGQLAQARQLINAVYQDMPNSRAAIALKIAIDTRLNNSGQ